MTPAMPRPQAAPQPSVRLVRLPPTPANDDAPAPGLLQVLAAAAQLAGLCVAVAAVRSWHWLLSAGAIAAFLGGFAWLLLQAVRP